MRVTTRLRPDAPIVRCTRLGKHKDMRQPPLADKESEIINALHLHMRQS
jgi:hypothetical protein